MLKKRIIPALLIRDVGLVKGESFDSWRRVGMPMQAVKVFNTRDVDELILLDIGATPERREPDFQSISELAAECFVPLTVGGGVRSVESIRGLLLAGADKVAVNTAMYEQPALLTEGARIFGSQCIVAAIDYRPDASGTARCFSHCGATPQGIEVVDQARRAELLGAGEILLTSIDRDGTLKGLDLKTIQAVSAAVRIPVIAAGGAGSPEDFRAALQLGASAVAAGAIWQFTQTTPFEIKAALKAAGVPVRV